jgi:hypothetical protein
MIKRISKMMPMIIEMTNILYSSELIGNEENKKQFYSTSVLRYYRSDIQHHSKCLDEI